MICKLATLPRFLCSIMLFIDIFRIYISLTASVFNNVLFKRYKSCQLNRSPIITIFKTEIGHSDRKNLVNFVDVGLSHSVKST